MVIKSNVISNDLSLNFYMDSLQSILPETDDPVFIVGTESKKIYEANRAALDVFPSLNPIGKKFDSLVRVYDPDLDFAPVYLNQQWLHIYKESFFWQDDSYLKITLRPNPAIPDYNVLLSCRNMVAVIANRLRSPLTGMEGYLDLIQDMTEKKPHKMIDKVRMGLDQLIEIIDELEAFHNLKKEPLRAQATQSGDPEQIIRELLYSYPVEVRNRIKILRSKHQNKLNANPGDLRKILTQLIDNAVEHSSGKDSDIVIDLRAHQSVKVSNGGKPIPDSVRDKLFFPFVTGKANNMGIGLTIAQMLAKRQNGHIYLSENRQEHITFTFCLPITPEISII